MLLIDFRETIFDAHLVAIFNMKYNCLLCLYSVFVLYYMSVSGKTNYLEQGKKETPLIPISMHLNTP